MTRRKSSMSGAVVRNMIDTWILVHAKYQETTGTPGREGNAEEHEQAARPHLKARTFVRMLAVCNRIRLEGYCAIEEETVERQRRRRGLQ